MILQSLARYYEILQADDQSAIAPPGYSKTGISFALNISKEGDLLDVFPLFVQESRGNKTVEVPRRMVVPEQVKRSSGIVPNFLCDNNVYVLGMSEKRKDNPENEKKYALERHNAFSEHNREILSNADCDAAKAVIAFLDHFNQEKIIQHLGITSQKEALLKGGNLVFMYQGTFVHQEPMIRQAWEQFRAGKDVAIGRCLVTGEKMPIARLHTNLKRVRGAQSSGATLVGFNAPAYESYNKAQGMNAPVSEKAVFAYTTALNYLLSVDNTNPPIFLGDATVVYWAESDKKEYAAAFASIFGGEYAVESQAPDQVERKNAEAKLGKVARNVAHVRPVDITLLTKELDENVQFYVLGLSPNASRISVRFFITEPFGRIIQRIMRHYKDLEIDKEFESQPDFISLPMILDETVSPKAKDQEAMPLLAGSVLRAILNDLPYPAALYSALITRFRADMDDGSKKIRKINYVRAAVVKAVLRRKYRRQTNHPYQEVLEMSLNETSTIPAYVLGRLFAVLEKVQQEAVGNVNASIKDRYFTSACASPATVFPMLLRLSQHHISKADYGYASDRRIEQLLNLLSLENNPFPAHFSLDEQGLFVLGYYHQRVAFFIPRSGKESAEQVE